jgi:hypothetical protein
MQFKTAYLSIAALALGMVNALPTLDDMRSNVNGNRNIHAVTFGSDAIERPELPRVASIGPILGQAQANIQADEDNVRINPGNTSPAKVSGNEATVKSINSMFHDLLDEASKRFQLSHSNCDSRFINDYLATCTRKLQRGTTRVKWDIYTHICDLQRILGPLNQLPPVEAAALFESKKMILEQILFHIWSGIDVLRTKNAQISTIEFAMFFRVKDFEDFLYRQLMFKPQVENASAVKNSVPAAADDTEAHLPIKKRRRMLDGNL